jgi:hypothetical protein
MAKRTQLFLVLGMTSISLLLVRVSGRRCALALFFLACFSGSAGFSPLLAQIGYVQLQPDGSVQLRQMNADGSGDLQIGLPFTTFDFPVFSRDGTQLAVSALDPALPIERSQNVFSLSTTTGAVNELTFYGDLFDQVNGVIIYNFPFYKAFSPDNTKLAVFAYIQYANANDIGTQTTSPSLEIYSTTTAGAPLQVHVDKGLNGTHHGGEGVDWSPDGSVLAAPLEGSTNFISGGGPGEITSINLIEPSAGAVVAGHFQQVTFPRADAQISGQTPFLWGEHDYQPKFSPNGVGIAYVRSFQNFFLLTSQTPDPDIQTIRIVNLTTGADSQVIQFSPGQYISSLDWSPDGTQLVFDLGQQAPGPLGPQQHALPETNEVYVVNNDGSGLTKLRAAGASTPAWSRTALPAPLPPNLGNISTRLSVGGGDDVLIGGFIIIGTGDKNVVVRAIGPSLGDFGVSGALADPTLELHDQTGAVIATNDNWKDTQEAELATAGLAPSNSKESAIVRRLTSGAYTAIVRGKNGATGVGLVEAYGLDGSGTLANISTRGLVETGDNVMIGGFIVLNTGAGATDVIVRAIGPSLAGVTGALPDPILELHDSNGATVASNDNWKATQKSAIEASGLAPNDDRESAILKTLSAGAYTAIVRGKNNATGIALIEAYNLQ